MKFNNILALFISIVLLSGCSLITTNKVDKNGKVQIIKELKIGKNKSFSKGLATIATAIFIGKMDDGAAAATVTAILNHDIQRKAQKAQQQRDNKINIKTPNEKI